MEEEAEAPWYQCTKCGAECEGEPAYVGVPHRDDGLPDEWCPDCEKKAREWEARMGLLAVPEE